MTGFTHSLVRLRFHPELLHCEFFGEEGYTNMLVWNLITVFKVNLKLCVELFWFAALWGVELPVADSTTWNHVPRDKPGPLCLGKGGLTKIWILQRENILSKNFSFIVIHFENIKCARKKRFFLWHFYLDFTETVICREHLGIWVWVLNSPFPKIDLWHLSSGLLLLKS